MNQTDKMKCKYCGSSNVTFDPQAMFALFPPISPVDVKNGYMPVSVSICDDCGHLELFSSTVLGVTEVD